MKPETWEAGETMAVFPQGPPEQTDAEVDRLANLAFERILARLTGA